MSESPHTPDRAASPGHERLRELMYARLRLAPEPLLLGPGFGIPAASLWAGARNWLTHLRARGLGPGDRLVVALGPTPAFVQVALAAWWDAITLVVLAPGETRPMEERLRVAPLAGPHTIVPTPENVPRENDATPARPALPRPTAPATTNAHPTEPTLLEFIHAHPAEARWSAEDLARGLAEPLGPSPTALGPATGIAPGIAPGTTLTVRPWWTPAGFLGELAPALFAGAGIIEVEPSHGEDATSVVVSLRERVAEADDGGPPCRILLSPALLDRLLLEDDGVSILARCAARLAGDRLSDAADVTPAMIHARRAELFGLGARGTRPTRRAA